MKFSSFLWEKVTESRGVFFVHILPCFLLILLVTIVYIFHHYEDYIPRDVFTSVLFFDVSFIFIIPCFCCCYVFYRYDQYKDELDPLMQGYEQTSTLDDEEFELRYH